MIYCQPVISLCLAQIRVLAFQFDSAGLQFADQIADLFVGEVDKLCDVGCEAAHPTCTLAADLRLGFWAGGFRFHRNAPDWTE